MEKRKKHQNVQCSLISSEENDKLFRLLGLKCFTLASAVVQVFLTQPPGHSSWIKKFCGVGCFVKDFIRKSYFIMVFDMDKYERVWEQEVYNQFVYGTPRPFFHTFEADNCMTGLNFASNEEALEFSSAVKNMLNMRQERRIEKKRNNNNSLAPSNANIIVASRASSESSLVVKEKPSKKMKKKKLTKEDIGVPTNFVHHQHVGWDPVTGFDLTDVEDPTLKEFFDLAGVSEKDLKDNETRKFIYEFLDDHGGVEAAKQELLQRSCSPQRPPVREAPPTPRAAHGSPSMRSAAPPPPPPPPSVPPAVNHHVPAPSRGAPPPVVNHHVSAPSRGAPPPAQGRMPARPRPPMAVIAPLPPSHTTPMPPPPPPPPPQPPPAPPSHVAAAPPPPPPMPSSKVPPSSQPDSRSALLDQIRKGKMLNHVDKEVVSNNAAPVDDARGALLNQIRRGIELKPVTEEQKPTARPMNGLAEALAKALRDRNQAIHHTDESDSGDDEDNDEDEWDD